MKNLIFTLIILLIAITSNAQDKADLDYITISGNDPIYCIITNLTRVGGNVSEIEYYDLDKQKHIIKKKEVKKVERIRVAGVIMDYIPLKASKPNSYQRHIELKVDGKIKIYDHIRLIAKTDENGERKLYSVVGAGANIYTIKLPDGNYYKINKSNLKKTVIPYMRKCKKFNSSFQDLITAYNIEDAVKNYNEICD